MLAGVDIRAVVQKIHSLTLHCLSLYAALGANVQINHQK